MQVPPGELAMPAEVAGAWEKFLAIDREFGPTDQTFPPPEAVFEDGWIFPLQRKAELAAMVQLAHDNRPISRTAGPNVLEIGTDKGGGFYWWMSKLRPAKAIAIEIRGVPFAEPMRKAFPKTKLLALEESSFAPETVAKVREFLGKDRLDVVFLDGDKGNYHRDFEAYLPLVRPGGLVFLHDIVDDIEPRRFFWSLRSRFRLSCIIDAREGALAGLETGPPTSAWNQWLRHWGANSCGVGVVHV